MSAYAQNASAGGGGGYASLSGSLLARKGEALPAVDAVAHEGVDIEMRPMQPANSPGAPKNISEETIETLRENGQGRETGQPGETETQRRSAVRLVHSASSPAATRAPEAWTITPPARSAGRMGAQRRLSPPSRTKANGSAASSRRSAICKLRMPAPDLVRLRFAARDMEMSCQAIILEALECYLDANDVPATTDDAIQAEVERLLARAARKS
ncbi:hypothetical protein [Hyphococcus sp.]|uniref:hypothetical protein n=1 Tax=Hyphococcus sp. TaxID=2038636 RepID=UPI003CCB8704